MLMVVWASPSLVPTVLTGVPRRSSSDVCVAKVVERIPFASLRFANATYASVKRSGGVFNDRLPVTIKFMMILASSACSAS